MIMNDTKQLMEYLDGIIHLSLGLKYRVGPKECHKLIMEYVDALCTEGTDIKLYAKKKHDLISALKKPLLSVNDYSRLYE